MREKTKIARDFFIYKILESTHRIPLADSRRSTRFLDLLSSTILTHKKVSRNYRNRLCNLRLPSSIVDPEPDPDP